MSPPAGAGSIAGPRLGTLPTVRDARLERKKMTNMKQLRGRAQQFLLRESSMDRVYLFRVESSEGTEAHNVARTVRYAAEQLGLVVLDAECMPPWRRFNARIIGSAGEVSRLVGVVELAFPKSQVGVRRQFTNDSPNDDEAPAD